MRVWNRKQAETTSLRGSELKDDPCGYPSGQDIVDGLVYFVDFPVYRDDLGAPGRMKGEDVGEVVARSDDRTDDGLAVDDGVKDRKGERCVVCRQRDAHQSPATAQ